MNTLTIVDTDILIDAGQDVREAVECLADIEQQSTLAISIITQMELLISKNQRDYRFIHGLQLLPYPRPSASESE